MCLGGPLDANEELAELVKPREASLDLPAQLPESRAVVALAPSDCRRDATTAKLFPVRVAVIAAICDKLSGSPPGSAACPADGGDGVYEREKLRDVVNVGRGEDGRERDAGRVGPAGPSDRRLGR